MKNIVLIILATVTISSCNEFLELDPQGAPSSENFWLSEQDAEAASSSLYLMNDFQGTYGRGMNLYSLIASPYFVVGKSKAQIERIKNFQNDGTGSYTRDIWSKHYIVIKRANDIIVNVPEMSISPETKNFVLGQAYFMRGLSYFELSLLYGNEENGVPIVEEEVETFYLERASHVSENYEFAANDFITAAGLLPYFEDLDVAEYGRAHKNAAWGYLARTHLHNAQYDPDSWAKVVRACDEIINSGKNRLEENFADVFKIENNWGSEYLWSVPSNTRGGSILPGASLENRGWGLYNGWGYFAPTQEMYDLFETEDERRIVSILGFGDEFQFFGETRQYWSTTNLTGFQFGKYLDGYAAGGGVNTNANGDHPTTDLDLKLLRYADILLMKSEALIMGGLNGDAPLNEVRTRAGLTTAISGATLDDLKRERKAELVGELFGSGYEDLVRWGETIELTKALTGRIHTDKSDPKSLFTIEEVWPARPHFDMSIHDVWPIPPSEINASRETLVQNNGW